MKRAIAALCVAVCLFVLCGCGQSQLQTNLGQTIEDWAPDRGEQASVGEYESPDFSDKLHFKVTAWPQDETYEPTEFFSINQWFGQIQYHTADGRTLVVRVARDNSSALAAAYTENHYVDKTVRDVDGVEVTTAKAQKGCTLVTWTKDGFQYSLHSGEQYEAPGEQEVDIFVRGLHTEAAPAGG